MVAQGAPIVSNERYSYPPQASLADLELSETWKAFVREHTSDYFLKRFTDLFRDQIDRYYPQFEQTIASIETLKAGIRKVNDFSQVDVLMDAQICINAPVTAQPEPIKPPHVDRPQVLFVGLFYLRRPDDESIGGDLEIFRFKQGKPYGFRGQFIDHQYVERIGTVKYERNTLVLFLNSIDSVHGVTVRSRTNAPRCFVNLIGEVKQPLFDYMAYQERKSLIGRFAKKLVLAQ